MLRDMTFTAITYGYGNVIESGFFLPEFLHMAASRKIPYHPKKASLPDRNGYERKLS